MAKNNGIKNAQNNVFDQNDDAIGGRSNGDVFRLGSAQAPGFDPGPGTNAGSMWDGTGIPNTNWNLTDKGNLETGLKIHQRGGADYTPTGPGGANGEQDYNVAAGTLNGRATWNFDYVVDTAAGVAPGDLANTPGLDAYDFKMQITQSGPQFLTPHTAIFDLDPATHRWVDESNPLIGFGGDDFTHPDHGASALVQAHVAENSENIAFLLGEFGPGLTGLADATAAGTQYDIKLVGFKAGTGNLETFTHDHITLVNPT